MNMNLAQYVNLLRPDYESFPLPRFRMPTFCTSLALRSLGEYVRPSCCTFPSFLPLHVVEDVLGVACFPLPRLKWGRRENMGSCFALRNPSMHSLMGKVHRKRCTHTNISQWIVLRACSTHCVPTSTCALAGVYNFLPCLASPIWLCGGLHMRACRCVRVRMCACTYGCVC